jgi:hypothetical protein
MAQTQIFGPYTISPNTGWYYWFNPTAIPDDRLRYCLARASAPSVGGVITTEVWVERVWSNTAGAGYYSYRVGVENRTSATATFTIAVHTFD